jgi:hypothetical protein
LYSISDEKKKKKVCFICDEVEMYCYIIMKSILIITNIVSFVSIYIWMNEWMNDEVLFFLFEKKCSHMYKYILR